MPEYLAPGVYVEETSFRAKSIEGVGTSTTAFVGPTRKGPIATTQRDAHQNLPAPPELLTSFGDFVRIYGGLEPLGFAASAPNYLANAVLAFFNEGGSRLYVSRVANGAAAASLTLAGNRLAGTQVIWNARFPGAAGNGTIAVREILAPANGRAMTAAPAGTLLRARFSPASPAILTGAAGPTWSVPEGAVLRVTVSGTPAEAAFHGQSAEITTSAALPNPVALTPANRNVTVSINGVAQTVALSLANPNPTPAEFTAMLNQSLVGAYARLEGTGELTLGTERHGFNATIAVTASPVAFPAGIRSNPRGAANNVGDLNAVTVADLRDLFVNNPGPGQTLLTANLEAGRLSLATTATGAAATLTVADATGVPANTISAHAALGLPIPAQPVTGGAGIALRLAVKNALGEWRAQDNSLLAVVAPAAEGGDFITLSVVAQDASGESEVFDELTLTPGSSRYIASILPRDPRTRAESLQQLYWLEVGANVDIFSLHTALFTNGTTSGTPEQGLGAVHSLSAAGGNDGGEPDVLDDQTDGSYAAAFAQLRGLEDISIIAAPGHSAYSTYRNIQAALISHVELPRAYRIAVLDTPPRQLPGEARQERAQIDSSRAALYYPWVTVANPLARPGRDQIPREINLPPSAFVAGIYARNDVEQSVAKAPANEVVRGALRFESDINFAQNQLLNPLGVNCLRYFPGRGYRVWGARTVSSDPEFKYVNVRRFFLYLESSIDRGTQWAVFENNGPRLWQNIRETIEAFLQNEWVSGNLLGDSPKEAYFVRCDRSTMTQNDLDNGRLICLIGVAALKPAEFVIFRIGQKTADARS